MRVLAVLMTIFVTPAIWSQEHDLSTTETLRLEEAATLYALIVVFDGEAVRSEFERRLIASDRITTETLSDVLFAYDAETRRDARFSNALKKRFESLVTAYALGSLSEIKNKYAKDLSGEERAAILRAYTLSLCHVGKEAKTFIPNRPRDFEMQDVIAIIRKRYQSIE